MTKQQMRSEARGLRNMDDVKIFLEKLIDVLYPEDVVKEPELDLEDTSEGGEANG